MDRPFAIELLDGYCRSVEAKHGPVLFDEEHAPLNRIARHFHSLGQGHMQQEYALGCLIGNLGIEIAGAGEDAKAKLNQIVKRWASPLRARSFKAQQTEVAIGCAVLNRMLACTRPKSVRRMTTTA
ncbi:hypothetical protein FHT86_002695 [Rhizobium sp. BK313]|nr:hypothetical protein [Rhizobium sp. BK313]